MRVSGVWQHSHNICNKIYQLSFSHILVMDTHAPRGNAEQQLKKLSATLQLKTFARNYPWWIKSCDWNSVRWCFCIFRFFPISEEKYNIDAPSNRNTVKFPNEWINSNLFLRVVYVTCICIYCVVVQIIQTKLETRNRKYKWKWMSNRFTQNHKQKEEHSHTYDHHDAILRVGIRNSTGKKTTVGSR